MSIFARRPSGGHRGAVARLVGLIVAAQVAVLFLVLPPAAAARTGTTTDEVALLAEPDDRAAVLLTLPADVRLAIEGRAEDGYYPVDYAGLDGWVETGSLADAVDGGGDAAGDPAAVATDEVDLLADPAAAAAVLLVIPDDDPVELTGQQAGAFVEVAYDGETGWVLGRDLEAAAVSSAPSRRGARDGGILRTGDRPIDYGYSEAEMVRFIYDAADYYGQSRKDMLRVATCESQLTATAVNPRTGDAGLFQFNPDTWLTTPYGRTDIFDPRASAYAAGWMWSVGRRNEWVCQ